MGDVHEAEDVVCSSKLHVALAVSVCVVCLSKRLNWCLFVITIALEMSAVCLA